MNTKDIIYQTKLFQGVSFRFPVTAHSSEIWILMWLNMPWNVNTHTILRFLLFFRYLSCFFVSSILVWIRFFFWFSHCAWFACQFNFIILKISFAANFISRTINQMDFILLETGADWWILGSYLMLLNPNYYYATAAMNWNSKANFFFLSSFLIYDDECEGKNVHIEPYANHWKRIFFFCC